MNKQIIKRALDLSGPAAKKSIFLFGPRATGKSFLLRSQFPEAPTINLLKSRERKRYLENPSLLEDYAKAHQAAPIIIDEIQLVPELLDEVHALIEEEQRIFILTGSSARKLKRGGGNLLAGRAKTLSLHPLNWYELSSHQHFQLDKHLLYGGIPNICLSSDPVDELSDYVDTYLTEEIKAETQLRNIKGYEKFLTQVAIRNGELINYSSVASDAQIAPPTVREYYQLLEDTLLGFFLQAWKGPKRKAVQTTKFYFFDLGVSAFLAGIESLPSQSNLFGNAFEHFVILEVKSFISYKRKREGLYFWRTLHQEEVDLIVGNKMAIEIKSTEKASIRDAKHLKKIKDEAPELKLVVISRDRVRRNTDGLEFWYYEEFFQALWNEEFF